MQKNNCIQQKHIKRRVKYIPYTSELRVRSITEVSLPDWSDSSSLSEDMSMTADSNELHICSRKAWHVMYFEQMWHFVMSLLYSFSSNPGLTLELRRRSWSVVDGGLRACGRELPDEAKTMNDINMISIVEFQQKAYHLNCQVRHWNQGQRLGGAPRIGFNFEEAQEMSRHTWSPVQLKMNVSPMVCVFNANCAIDERALQSK
jgi:hypothetical protein